MRFGKNRRRYFVLRKEYEYERFKVSRILFIFICYLRFCKMSFHSPFTRTRLCRCFIYASTYFFYVFLILFKENGTTPYDASLLGNVTINMAENEIDNGHETATENAVDDARRTITETSRRAFTVTLAQPSDKASVWGPFFEDGTEPHNVTAKLGMTVELDCKIGLLYDKTVSTYSFALRCC